MTDTIEVERYELFEDQSYHFNFDQTPVHEGIWWRHCVDSPAY